jgi:hypothetical protein
MPHRIFAVGPQFLGDPELTGQLLRGLPAHIATHNFSFTLI